MTTKKKTSNEPAPVAAITLTELTARYTKHMEDVGKSRGTVFSYESELRVAQRALGAERSIGAITREDIETFNGSPWVTTMKNGCLKSQLSIDKTRRVLRLALAWAAENKLIASSPAAPIEADAKAGKRAKKANVDEKKTDAPEAKPTKRGAKKTDAPASEPAPVAKKPRRRKGAIVLEVAQPEAELAADAAEAHIANSTETLA
jgi:hypothetical protein